MTDLSAFPVTQRWVAAYPDRLQLYSFPTPNGIKVSIMLEEIGMPYEAHLVDIGQNESKDPAFVSLNPNGRIPAILDPDGPKGQPLLLWESGAILVYLAEKSGAFLSADPVIRYETLQWVFFQMSGIGPMFGQLGYFHKFAGREIADRRPFERYLAETQRLLGVLDARLTGRAWLVGDGGGEYSIADIATLGWVRALEITYQAGALIGLVKYQQVTAWLEKCLSRPAVQRGLSVPVRP
ncbi:glutathione S-transferase N-terminal domain-containing protein [Sphingomonas montana]|uniref:glutathione S-transferase N-terminal domain-containing protein n=1 Tax=Sphingomonas montana TaxID=1843236 RepID=UPI00096DDE0A|nr:glutathione S-transferase N-terminal domain-containing protein [Sphingomonas montana]